eukprot:TRINITY_DN286_c0_g1_i1.p1 TRINITY_DN286_c0_g1~~TRINITY_DN286_c0_g1_i1.p1  ORF type:complete len:515 (-),score=118.35 TRINITY_DN286_c0_g1_i1:47-1591(-)
MKAWFAVLIGLVCALAVTVTAENVIILTESNFDSIVNEAEFVLVEFFAPWCGHCKRLAPEYEQAATTLKDSGSDIKLASVDCTENEALAGRFGIQGYPTLKIFRRGTPFEYNGPREAAGIVSYLEKQAGPSSKPLKTASEVDAFIAKSQQDVGFVAFSENDADLAIFRSVANNLRDDFIFGEVSDADLIAKYNHKGVVAYKKYDDKEAEFKGTLAFENLKDWVNAQALALAGEITNANKKRYDATGLPLVGVYFDVDHEKNIKRTSYYLRRIEQAAKDFAGKVLFGISHNSLLSSPELKGKGPETVILTDKSQKVYKYPVDSAFSVAGLKSWVQDFIDNKLKPSIKSEPIPEPSTSGATVVVGENFDEVVLDNDKDVLIDFYAPWCGHCKTLAPEWDKLADELRGVDSIRIVKIDATANDWPKDKFAVQGYPSIFFKNGKGQIQKYESGRSVADFVRFLETNASTKFESPSAGGAAAAGEDKKEKKKEKKKDKKKEKKEKKKDKKDKKHDKDEL